MENTAKSFKEVELTLDNWMKDLERVNNLVKNISDVKK